MVDNKTRELLLERYGIVGHSAPILNAIGRLVQAAPTDLTVLITGETGTGKEVFAHALHGLSKRKKNPFVSVNCAAIPETLLESELFGHEKGAFTGALDRRQGFFEVADNGTIFLDEIGDMPYMTQVKLLRVLESGEFSRLGSSSVQKVNVRVIAATNKVLEDEVKAEKFRQDLYFRLKNVNILLPRLKDHLEDIPVLVNYFAMNVADKNGLKYNGISSDAVKLLESHSWDGNVRELKNLIEMIVTLEKAEYLTLEVFRKYIKPALPPHEIFEVAPESSLIPLKHQDEFGNFELGLIFKTLLELKSDVSDLKRGMHIIINEIEESKKHSTQSTTEEYEEYRDIQAAGNQPEDLNILNNEKVLIEKALEKHDGNRRHAANELGISERTLYRKIQDYDINK